MIRQGILIFEDTPAAERLVQRRVAGLSLLDRGIRTMARAGIERLAVVVPDTASVKLTHLTQNLDLKTEFLTWNSVASLTLPAGAEVLVLLGDHVHHASSLADLVKEGLGDCECIVQTSAAPDRDRSHHQVSASAAGIAFTAISSASAPVSTGAFLCSAELLAQDGLAAGRTDFHAFLQARAAGRRASERPLSSPLWHKVWDRRSARVAKNMLFGQVTKPTSGFVSRHLNARVSIPISKLLVETGMSPHLITVFFVMTTGLTSAVLVSRADDYFTLVLAGFLWQMAAILDRCDGEVARVKLCESKFGAWFDTVTDNFAYVCAYIGMLFGMRRLHPDTMLYSYLGISAGVALILTLAILYIYAHRTGSGSLQHYLRDLSRDLPDGEKSWIQKLMQRYGFVGKRDFFSFFVFLATLVNSLEIAYWFLVTTAHLAAGAVLVSQSKMLRSSSARAAERKATSSGEKASTDTSPAEDRR